MVTTSEKRKWLNGYRWLVAEYRQLAEERRRWLTVACHITPQYSATPKGGSGNADKIQRSVEKLAEIDEKIAKQLERTAARRQEIENAIDSLSDSRYRVVLRCRYLDGESFERIATRMNYSYRWVKALHRQGLEEIEKSESD